MAAKPRIVKPNALHRNLTKRELDILAAVADSDTSALTYEEIQDAVPASPVMESIDVMIGLFGMLTKQPAAEGETPAYVLTALGQTTLAKFRSGQYRPCAQAEAERSDIQIQPAKAPPATEDVHAERPDPSDGAPEAPAPRAPAAPKPAAKPPAPKPIAGKNAPPRRLDAGRKNK